MHVHTTWGNSHIIYTTIGSIETKHVYIFILENYGYILQNEMHIPKLGLYWPLDTYRCQMDNT
jgi:hypothetical protein